MTFTDLHTFSVFLCIVIFFIWGYFLIDIYRRQRAKVSILLLLSILTILVIAVLGPRWWLVAQTQNYVWSNIVFLVDVSKSMDALDFDDDSLSRLDTTKYFISEFIKWNPNNKYALDVFSGDAVRLLPFTNDSSIYQTVLSSISESSVWTSWSDILWAITTSLSHFSDDTPGLIVMLTDGWDDEIKGTEELQAILKDTAVELMVIGVGNEKWSYIPTSVDVFGRVQYKTYQWKRVVTRLNDSGLIAFTDNLWVYKKLDSLWDIQDIFRSVKWTSEKLTFVNNSSQRRNLVFPFMMIVWILWIFFILSIWKHYKKTNI